MLPQKLKQLREEKGINQIDLARDMQVTQGTVCKWETGERTPETRTLKKLADYFGVSADYLLGNDENPDFVVHARHLSEIPQEDRKQLIDAFKDTMDAYLKAKGLK